MKSSKRIVSLLLSAAMIAILMAGCGGNKNAAAADEPAATTQPVIAANDANISDDAVIRAQGNELADTLKVVLKAEPSNLLPFANTEIYAATVERCLFNTLVTRDTNQEFVGELAKSWEYVDDVTVRFHLNEGITFSDGTELTAEDVAFSIMMNNESSKSVIYGVIADCKVVDHYTVDIITTSANAALFSNLAIARTSIISKAYYEKVGPDEYGRNPIGSGPMVIDEWVTGNSISLKVRDDYWAERPSYDNLVIKFVTESANRSIELETDEVDILIDPEPNDLNRLAEEGYNVIANASYSISQFKVNAANVPDENIRKALAYAVDYDALVDAVYADTAVTAKGLFPLIMLGYEENFDISYDPDLAKELVASSGNPNPELEVIVSSDTELSTIAETLQYYWRQAGITVNIHQADQASIRERATAGDFDIYIDNSNWSTGDPSRCTSIFNYASGKGTFGLPEEVAVKCQEYWDAGLAAIDEKERVKIYSEYQQFINEQLVFFPLAHKKIVYVTNSKVDNFYANPNGSPDLKDVVIYK